MKVKEMFAYSVEFQYFDDYLGDWISEEFLIVTEKDELQKEEAEAIIAKGTSLNFFVSEITPESPTLVALSEGAN